MCRTFALDCQKMAPANGQSMHYQAIFQGIEFAIASLLRRRLMTSSILERAVDREVSRLRRLFLAVVTLFWVGLTPLRNELEEAGLVRRGPW